MKKSHREFDFEEVDEEKTPTPGIRVYPTVRIHKGMAMKQIDGRASEEQIMKAVAEMY